MICFLYVLLSSFIPSEKEFKFQNGDLIFQEACSGDSDNTIKAVTASIGNYQFTHVGIVYIDDKDSVYVLEATRPTVTLTPIDDFLYPDNQYECYPKSVVGRLKQEYIHLIPEALTIGLGLIGKEYDDGFILGNDKYYCSELVYDILMKANNNNPVFPLNRMTFKSEDKGEFTEGWIQYFEKYKLPIPEGELGINPGAMSRSDVIDIVHCFK